MVLNGWIERLTRPTCLQAELTPPSSPDYQRSGGNLGFGQLPHEAGVGEAAGGAAAAELRGGKGLICLFCR